MSAAHLLGYLSQPTSDEMPRLKSYGVHAKALVGRMGLERVLDDVLRGRAGGLMVEVNNRGRQVGVIGQREPEAGGGVSLTIDAPLQSLIEQSFGAQAGACVVLDPTTGAVLSMVSLPAFPPEAFVLPDPEAVRRLLNEPSSPLMNRATVGLYQPGSIVKLITTAAALEQQVVTPTTTIVCPGSLTIGDRTFHCWNQDGHGPLTLPEAIMHSCNVYFMQVGRKLGAARLRDAMDKAGLSRRTGWLLEEQAGHLPQRRLTEGEVALLSIGQGEVLTTVLQMAVIAAAVANNGWLVEPWVISAVAERPAAHPSAHRRLGWSASTLEMLRTGMRWVVERPEGTGHGAFSPHVSIAGKTGTAQTHVPGRPHGWFVGFCPVEQPRLAMAIVAEHGGSGGELPAAIAKTICEYLSASEPL
jgi:penicillin-binding protein 2